MTDIDQGSSATDDPYDVILRMRLAGMATGPTGPASPTATPTNPFVDSTPIPQPPTTGPAGVPGSLGPQGPDLTPVPQPPTTGPAGVPGDLGPQGPSAPAGPTTPVNDVAPSSTGIVLPPPGSTPIDTTNATNAATTPTPTSATTPLPPAGTTAPAPLPTTTTPPAATGTTPTPTDTGASKMILPPGVPQGSSMFSQNDAKTETGWQYPDGTLHWFGLDGKEVAAPEGKTGSGPTTGAPVGSPQSGSDLVATASQSLDDIMAQAQQIAGTSPEVGVLFTQQLQSILAMIDGEEKKLREQYDAQGTTMDPATQFNLDTLRKQLTEGIQKNNEDLNSRGLYNSGIAMDLQQKLQTGELSGEAQVLAARFDKLQTQLASGLQALSGERITSARDLGLAGANAQSQADENTINRRTAAAQQLLGFRNAAQGQLSTQRFNAAMQAQSLAAEAQRQQEDFQAQEQRLQEQLSASAAQGDATRSAELQRVLIETRAAADRAASDNAAAMARVQAQEAAANARAQQQLTNGGSAVYTDRAAAKYLQTFPDSFEAAKADVLQNQNNLTQDGVNIQTLLQTLQSQYAARGIYGNER